MSDVSCDSELCPHELAVARSHERIPYHVIRRVYFSPCEKGCTMNDVRETRGFPNNTLAVAIIAENFSSASLADFEISC